MRYLCLLSAIFTTATAYADNGGGIPGEYQGGGAPGFGLFILIVMACLVVGACRK